MCGQMEQSELLTGCEWRTVRYKIKEAGIELKKMVPCPVRRKVFYKKAVNMSVEEIRKHFNSGWHAL